MLKLKEKKIALSSKNNARIYAIKFSFLSLIKESLLNYTLRLKFVQLYKRNTV